MILAEAWNLFRFVSVSSSIIAGRAKAQRLHVDDGKMWTNPYSASSSSTFSTWCAGCRVPRPDVGLRTIADALVGEGHGRVAYDGHDLVPVASISVNMEVVRWDRPSRG